MNNLLKLIIVFCIGALFLSACSKSDNDPPNPNNPPPNPTAKFDPANLVITILETDYEPGDNRVYIDYHVRNTSPTQSYNINDSEWDILFKVKATDGYEFSNHVNLLSIEAESDYEHGLPINVSTGKTLDLSTLTFEVVPDMD